MRRHPHQRDKSTIKMARVGKTMLHGNIGDRPTLAKRPLAAIDAAIKNELIRRNAKGLFKQPNKMVFG